MASFLQKYKAYFLPLILGALLMVAVFKSPPDGLSTSANKIENFISDQQNEFDRIAALKVSDQQKISASSRIKLFVFNHEDSLLLYNDNTVPLPAVFEPDTAVSPAIVDTLKNGWYLHMGRKGSDGHITLGYVLIKKHYRFENKFLKNEYDVGFAIPANYTISRTPILGSVPVHSREGKVIFSLYADDTHLDMGANYPLVLIYLLILLIICYYLNIAAMALARSKGPLWGIAFLSIVAITIRVAMITTKFPAEFYKLDLFNPSLYGSTAFASSLGDLILTCLMFFWLSAFYFNLDTNFSLSLFTARQKRLEQVFLICLQFVGSGSIFWIFRSLVMDSVISLEVYNILSLNQYSFLGLTCITLLLTCHFLFSINAFRRLLELGTSLVFLLSGTVIAGCVFTVLVYDVHFAESILFTTIWSIFFAVVGFRAFRHLSELRSARNNLIFILLYSILSMFLIENLYEHKERAKREFYAGKLLAGHDFIAEFTYNDIAERISSDKVVESFFTHPHSSSRKLRDRVNSLYFSGYFGKYDIKVYAYDSLGLPMFPRDTVPYANFKSVFDTTRNSPLDPDLVYINDTVLNSTYIGIIPVDNDDNKIVGEIALYMTPKVYNGQNVYPELLLGQNIISTIDNSTYNFAIYHNDKLMVQHGDYPYPYYWDQKLNTSMNHPRFIEDDAWEHLVCKFTNNRTIIISIPQEGFFEPVATMSYFFVIYFILTSLIIALFNLSKSIRANTSLLDEINLSFRTRINYSMLAIIIVSFIVIGLLTISFFKSQYDTFYTDRLIRKEKAIQASIENYIHENYETASVDNNTGQNDLGEILGIELVKIADINNIDINIFDMEGDLASSSQPAVFDNGFIAKRMEPTAYHKLRMDHEAQYTQQERIGRLTYTASYAPIRNKAGATVAFLSVPYFEKTKTINDEVSAFLSTLMNAYVFLLLCAAVLAYFISNSITRPLRFISEKLRILNLNKKNEPIEWNSKDEVGVLIAEYNKMIAELESSASKLAKSERESAWREMARQIAHEIKNPLTPMKLSIQYLQRSIDEGKDVTELAKKVNKTLIEQIDNLSAIATAFSTFAQMPKSNNEKIDLNEILAGIVALFGKEDNVQLTLMPYSEDACVYADKNQMISVFNNLIKNAIQSVAEGVTAEILVEIRENEGYIRTSVTDNGSGIAPESYDKVFVPNFTTKSSGTGLGLAICRQIVEGAKGNIWFESEMGKGTTFFVDLPYVREE